MKTRTLFISLLMLMVLLSGKLYAVEHGSINEKNVQLSLNDEVQDGYFVDFKLVSLSSMTYAYIEGTGYTLANTSWGSQLRYEGEKQCPLDNRTGNISSWSFATPAVTSASIHIMQEAGENNFCVTPDFTYDKTISNSPVAGDETKPVLSSAVASNETDNAITIDMSATDDNDFFYYISTPDMETVSFTGSTTISGLMAGTDYAFTVIAIDFSGNESEPIVINTTTTGTRPEFNPADNLALNKNSQAANGTASDGNNGNYGDRWRGGGGNNPVWWEVNLGAEYVVNQVKIFLDPNDNAGGSEYEIQTRLSSNEEWETVATITDAVTKQNRVINFGATPARYVRYYGTAIANWDHNFAEFEVYGTGYYDPSAGNELANVFVTPVGATTYVGDEFQFTALAATGMGTTVEDAVFTWSLLEDAGASISSTGLFTATQTGTYTINAETTVDAITKSGTVTVTVGEARTASVVTLKQVIINNAASNASNIFFINEPVPFTLEIKDQYGNLMPDAEVDYQPTGEGVVDESAQTVAWPTSGSHSLSVTVGEVTESIDVEVIQGFEIPKADMSATASSGNGSLAIDGDYGSRWTSDGTVEGVAKAEDVTIDMGALYSLTAIEVRWEGACAAEYDVEVSIDGSTWRSLGGENRGNGIAPHFYRVAETIDESVQYIRINCAVPATGYGYSIYEVTAYGEDSEAPSVVSIAANSDIEPENICWSAATDIGSGVKEYEVYRDDELVETISHVDGTTEYCFAIYGENGVLKSTKDVNYQVAVIDNAGNKTMSNTIMVAVTITDINAPSSSDKEVIKTQYFTIDGREVINAASGLYIVKKTYDDNSVETEKLLVK